MQNKGNRSQLGNKLVAVFEHSGSIRNKLVDNSLSRLLLLNDSSDLAHQERTSVVQGVVINVVGQVLHIVLNRDNTLVGKLLDFLAAVLLPVLDVRVVAHTERTALCHISNVSLNRILNRTREDVQ